jgi:hypothetical protein
MYMILVPKPMHVAVATRCCRPGFNSWLAPEAQNLVVVPMPMPAAKAEACSRSFAVLSAQGSTAGLRLRHSRLAFGSMLEVSRDAAAAGEEQLDTNAAEQSKYCFICTVANDPCCDLPFTSWGRW